MLPRKYFRHNVNTTAVTTARLCRSPRQTPPIARFYSSGGSSGEANKTSPPSPPPPSWSSRALAPLAAGAAGLAVGLYYQKRRANLGGGTKQKNPSSESRDHQDIQGSISNNITTTDTTTTATTPNITTDVPDLNKLGLSDQIAYAPTPTSEDVTRQLNEGAWSCRPGPETGTAPAVGRYDGAQLGSNSPCEDAYLHGRFSSPLGSSGSDWMAWAVFDGHCGWQMSNLLTRELMPSVRRALGDVAAAKSTGTNGDDEDAIHDALKTAFTTLDDAVVQTAAATIESDSLSFPEKARRLEAAYAGACALLALFDPATRTLRVASTGDCRAVLGSRKASPLSSSSSSSPPTTTEDGDNSSNSSNSSSNWEATDLTVDHTGANPSEIARLQAQFPEEPKLVSGGRVWGMQPSRTFGDGMWKWTAKLKRTLRQHYNGLSLPSAARYKEYKEGPYLTAEPAVTTTARVPDGGFLILATDGLWDTMTSKQAVELVGRWLDWKQQQQQQAGEKPSSSPSTSDFGPRILGWKKSCQYEESKTTVQDENAAVHLIRNGLGGADDEMIRGALTFRYPNSRDIRDDITVQVVFFK